MLTNGSRLHVPLLIALIVLVYAHTIHYPFHLDDQQNIVTNKQIQVSQWSSPEGFKWLSALPYKESFSRPISYLTFSINWYFGQNDTTGYHLVNILIHIVTAVFLYYCVRMLLSSVYCRREVTLPENAANLVALIGSLLWALHPIQIQAVTYIVQRMSSQATLFSILALYFFIKNFSYSESSKRLRTLLFTAILYCLAFLSKENAIILPFSCLLVQLVFYAKDKRLFSLYLKRTLLFASGLIIVGALGYVFLTGILEQLLANNQYPGRPFTLLERLLTQPRIIVFHLSQLLYPLSTRFSIDHSFILSKSLFFPWSTFPALCLILGITVFSVLKIKSLPLLSFALLFFLINHLVESTILPLELVFEHRNYLPSLFFFLPIAYAIVLLITHLQKKGTIIVPFISFSAVMLIVMVGWSTYYRNFAWSSQEQLWLDATKKAPLNARPYAYLGQIYGFTKPLTEDKFKKSIYYYKLAYGKFGPISDFDTVTLQNIGKVYLIHGEYEKAKQYYLKAIESDTRFHIGYLELAQTYVRTGEYDLARSLLTATINELPPAYASQAYAVIGNCALQIMQYGLAVDAIGNAIRYSSAYSDKQKFFHIMGAAFTGTGNHIQAQWFLDQALRNRPSDIRIHLSALERSVMAGEQKLTDAIADRVLEKFSVDSLERTLAELDADLTSIPLDSSLVRPALHDAMVRTTAQFK